VKRTAAQLFGVNGFTHRRTGLSGSPAIPTAPSVRKGKDPRRHAIFLVNTTSLKWKKLAFAKALTEDDKPALAKGNLLFT